jgi:putative transcriptional regulator
MNNLAIIIFAATQYLNMAKAPFNYNRIKEVLVAKGESNKSLAENLGVTETTVSTWCTNKNQPSIETIFEIAKFLDIDAGELLTTMKNFKPISQKKKAVKKQKS